MLCTLGFLYYITGICNFGGGEGKLGSSLRVVRGGKAGGVFTAKDLAPIGKKKSEFHGKQSINDYSASFLYELSFASVF